jgi:hypothetical protein
MQSLRKPQADPKLSQEILKFPRNLAQSGCCISQH